MFSSRRAQRSLCGSAREVRTKRVPVGRSSITEAEKLVADVLLTKLNAQGMYAQGFSDDI